MSVNKFKNFRHCPHLAHTSPTPRPTPRRLLFTERRSKRQNTCGDLPPVKCNLRRSQAKAWTITELILKRYSVFAAAHNGAKVFASQRNAFAVYPSGRSSVNVNVATPPASTESTSLLTFTNLPSASYIAINAL